MLHQTPVNRRDIPREGTMIRTLEQTTMRKVYLRVLPIAAVSYFFCYLDRINVGFAALTMNKDLGLDAATFGFAVGVFFWGYFLFEVPSNIVLEKLGARIWIARIMVTWGLLSGATAFCTGPYGFMTVRFLLGLAEAGFYPGLVLFFTYWFPDRHRARIVSGFTLALPVAVAAGAPMSTGIMELNGLWGLAGWKWMYLVEAVPTILLGIVVLLYLTDRPAQARWLSDEERAWLTSTIDHECRQIEAHRKVGLLQSFWDPKVLLLALNYFGIVTASIGMLIFLPQIVKQLGLTNMQVGWVTMIPYICGAISMVTWGLISDRMGERRWNLCVACIVSSGANRRHGVVPGRHLGRRDRILRQQGTVLVDAADVPHRHGSRREHRLDQLVRQSRWLLRAVHRRLGQRCNRQLRRRTLCTGGVRADGGCGLGAVAANSAPHSAAAGCGRDVSTSP